MYDIIGDIHGQVVELKALLNMLGYSNAAGTYAHPESRQVVFLGDFIDRGQHQRAVIDIVRPMVEQGHALAVMGNHEFNALAFNTQDPNEPGRWMRPRSEKNTRQHKAFLDDYCDDATAMHETLDWFRTLPLWLELDGFKVVHACWHIEHMKTLAPYLNADNSIKEGLVVSASRKGKKEYTALEVLLKGTELDLPADVFFKDKDGTSRREVRTKWWLENPETYAELAIVSEHILANNPALHTTPAPPDSFIDHGPKPVFIGHYWWSGTPAPLKHNVACLDYSVARAGGALVAYRWDGEPILSEKNFVAVDSVLVKTRS